MKFTTSPSILASALLLVAAPFCQATASHQRLHQLHHQRKHTHLHVRDSDELLSVGKRGGTCAFPSDESDIVAVTPDESNGGWAMSPDQSCKCDSYCPYACKPGMVMAQWDPDSSYTYPASMNGGMYCDSDGSVKKPFPDKPLCVPGSGSVQAVNKCSSKMSWCQTVLPGNEAMLIPTLVEGTATIAVPDTSYWQATAAHFYINPPGTGDEGCIWGDDSQPIGNWSPYVAGANTDDNGQTFVKIGWNPIYQSSGLASTVPNFGIKVECDGDGCNGLPCAIDPSAGLGVVDSLLAAVGAGDSAFCVVTVPKGSTASIVAYELGGGGGGDGGDGGDTSTIETSSAPPTSTVAPTTATPTPTPTSTSVYVPPSTTSTPTPTPTSTYVAPTSTSVSSTIYTPTSTSKLRRPTHLAGGIFHENGTHTSTKSEYISPTSLEPPSSTSSAPATVSDKEGEAGRKQSNAALAGLVVAFIATACFF